MKRFFTSLLLLMTLSAATWADLTVGNVKVTATGNVYPTGLTVGNIWYDASTNTLMLTGVFFATSENYAIRCTGSTKLNILVNGVNSISATYGGISCSGCDLELYGANIATASLTINSKDPGNGQYAPISVYAKETYIRDLTLVSTGNHWGINGGTGGTTPRQGTLKISNAAVKSTTSCTDSGHGAVAGFKSCTLTGCGSTDGTSYDSAKCAFKAAEGDDFAKSVNIALEEKYDLSILGKPITNLNASNFTVDGLTSGTISYESSSNTLTLNGVTMNSTAADVYGIWTDSTVGNLTIKLIGDNNITTTYDAVGTNSNMTFTGTGCMTLKSDRFGISCMGSCRKLVFENSSYFISDSKSVGIFGTQNEVVIKKVSTDPYGFCFNNASGGAAICNVEKLTLDNTDFYAQDGYPKNGTPGCYFDEAAKMVKLNGDNVASNVTFMSIKEKLPIYVCGKQLNVVYNTPGGSNDVIEVGSPYITAGGGEAVTYNPSTKTLTLNSATIDYQGTATNQGGIMVRSGDDFAIDIVVNGDNVIKGNNGLFSALWLQGNKTEAYLIGDGKLSLTSDYSNSYATYLSRARLAVGGSVTLESNAKGAGIGYNGSASSWGSLVIGEDAVVRASSISGLNSFTLNDGQTIVEPAGAEFKDGGVYVGNVLAQNVVIQKVKVYNLYVNGIQVNETTAADILGDGKVTFDAEAGELKLSGSNALTKIESSINDLKVIVTGENTIANNADNAILFDSRANITFEGDGTLNLKSTNKTSIGMRLAATYSDTGRTLSMTLQGPDFKITAGRGLYATGFNPILDIYYPSAMKYEPVEGSVAEPISGFLSFNLSQLAIVEPEGAYYNTTQRYVQLNDAHYTGPLAIDIQAYKLWIAGTQVNEVNKDDILGNGVFSYVSWYKTLHIAGDCDNTAHCRIIESSIDDLIINVDVDSKLTTAYDNYIIIYLMGNTEIQGGGTLTLKSAGPEQSNIAIYQDRGDKLTISNASIVVGDGFSYAITGESSVALVINSSDIVAKAHNKGCFRDFGSMTLNDCYIDSPRGAVYEDEALCDADGNIIGSGEDYETVVIKRGTDAINGLMNNERGASDIYDLAGRRLNSVNRGVNIVRTADGKTQKVLKK
ncbi:MAG: hypothetical protein IJ209_02095 [Bacteroidaceae bacterium]|nr:hypothetical protein [Bacteroidaceae bacterium]